MSNEYLTLAKIGIFNPGRLSDEEIEQSFITRIPFFTFIFKKIVAEERDSIPQHHLVIGQRGMGKTSLLVRIAAELRKEPYKKDFIALTFPEEQYNIDRLSKFWLNCLDALADALDKEQQHGTAEELDKEIRSLTKTDYQQKGNIYLVFEKWIKKINRRPVLLVDNLNLIFDKINKEEQHQLRATLMSNGAPIMVGASATAIDETLDYAAPFYDAFQINYLKKLSFEESMEVLRNLAKITNKTGFMEIVEKNRGRLEALYHLTGGTPRTIVMLFPLVQDGFSAAIQTDLDALLDTVTPLYKARFEELAPQMQVILDAVALHWDPVTLEQLSDITQLNSQTISPQLKRLTNVGWLQKGDAFEARGYAYEVSERFFNIWYLMRRSSRRQKRELYCLTRFLEVLYGNDVHDIANKRLVCKNDSVSQITLDLALADAVKDDKLKTKLKNKTFKELLHFGKNDRTILENFVIPDLLINKEVQKLISESAKLVKKENVEKALDKINQSINLNNTNCGTYYLKGLLLIMLGSYEQSEKAFLESIEIDDKQANVWYYLGNLYQNHLGRYDASESAYLKSLEIDDRNTLAWNSLGNLYRMNLKKYAASENAYLKSLEIDKKNGFVWLLLGTLYHDDLKKYDASEKAYLKAIEVDDKNTNAWIALAILYQNNLGRYDASVNAYIKALEIDDKNVDAWNDLGNLYKNHLGRYEASEKAYLKALEIEDKNIYVLNNLGNLYQNHLGRYEASEEAYLKSLEIDIKNTVVWKNLGVLYQNHLGKYDASEKAYLKVLEIDEKNEVVWKNLGLLYQNHLGKYDASEKAYLKALEIDNNKANLWNSLGNLYLGFLSKYREAETAFLKAIEVDDDLQYPKYNLIFLYRDNLNDVNKAKVIFQSIKINEDIEDSYWLNKALFDYYDGNAGQAKAHIVKAISIIKDKLPAHTQDDWWRAGAVIAKLGYGKAFLQILESTGHNTILRPYYEAVKALDKGTELYFNSLAAEIREPAKIIYTYMFNYNAG
jgi:tetratricopeptide (TPR) repeat protein